MKLLFVVLLAFAACAQTPAAQAHKLTDAEKLAIRSAQLKAATALVRLQASPQYRSYARAEEESDAAIAAVSQAAGCRVDPETLDCAAAPQPNPKKQAEDNAHK